MGKEDKSRPHPYDGLPLIISSEINEFMMGKVGFTVDNCGDLMIHNFKFEPKNC